MRQPLWAPGLLLLLAGPAWAAEQGRPKTEIFGGYSYTKNGDESLHGWDASVAVGLTRWIGAEADVSGHYGRQEGTHTSRLSFMGGPRFVYRTGGFAVFTHYLAGGVRSRAGIKVLGVEIAETSTDFGMAFGGGADVRLSGRWSARAQGDYVLIKADGGTEKEPRVSVGVVYRVGARSDPASASAGGGPSHRPPRVSARYWR